MPHDDIVSYLEGYAASFAAPVREGVGVESLEPGPTAASCCAPPRANCGLMSWWSAAARISVRTVQRSRAPSQPTCSSSTPSSTETQTASRPGASSSLAAARRAARSPRSCNETGREVALACGRAPWAPRRFGGRDVVSWISETDYFDTPLGSLPSPAARLSANLQATGRGGGHDLHYRTLQAMGVQLLGRLLSVDGPRALFADDLAESVAFGDARYAAIRNLLRDQLPGKGLPVPELPDPPPFRADPPCELDLGDFGVAIFTAGFRPDYTRWVRFPAFDELGFPLTHDGASTVVPGLFFCGVHFLRTRRSALLFGVGDDATLVARSVAGRLARGAQCVRKLKRR